MTLASHAVIGAAAAGMVAHEPVLGLFFGFSSHFLADAIPHWDYHLESLRRNKERLLDSDMELGTPFLRDLFRIGCDMLLGFVLVWALFRPDAFIFLSLMLGAFGGILPDALQFAYFKIRREPLVSLQKFHMWIHARVRIHSVAIGLPLQIGSVALLVLLFSFGWR